jgi:hypothetical protein
LTQPRGTDESAIDGFLVALALALALALARQWSTSVLMDRHAFGDVEIYALERLHRPASGFRLAVDFLAAEVSGGMLSSSVA